MTSVDLNAVATETAPPKPAPSLTKRAVRGAAWTLPTSLGTRVFGLVGTLLLARYIAPTEYGEYAAASIVAMSANTLTTFGIGTYLVATPGLTRDDVFHAS